MQNSAFVFIKPTANNKAVQDKVSATLQAKGCKILQEGDFDGAKIDADMLIDQHYYAIASKATILEPKDIPVPNEKFQGHFNLSWEDALKSGNVYNAKGACQALDVNATQLDELWGKCNKVKLGGGFYCGKIEVEGKTPIYTFNAFFMEMRSKFVDPSASIHYYVVEFSPNDLSWEDFRGKVLGPTDPSKAPLDSLRGVLLAEWKDLGMDSEPNVGDNCVHASASPFEGLAERMNWLKADVAADDFGKELLEAGVPLDTIKAWSVDPQVKGKSIFDQLEDMDADACKAKIIELAA